METEIREEGRNTDCEDQMKRERKKNGGRKREKAKKERDRAHSY